MKHSSIEHELTTTVVADPGQVVVCDSDWMGRDKGSRWELARVELKMDVTATSEGAFVPGPRADFHAYGYKLTKTGMRRSANTHLLPWIHNQDDLLRCMVEAAQ